MSHAPSSTLSERHQTVRQRSADAALDAFVVTSLPNILYLTNFTGSTAIVVLTADTLHFITDSRYASQVAETFGAGHQCPGLELTVVEGSYDETLARLLARSSGGRIGVESAHMTVSQFNWLSAAVGAGAGPRLELVPVEDVVEQGRIRKDPYELDTIREAARRLSRAAVAILGDVRGGQTERDVAMAIDMRIRQAGFERSAFDTIVAAGPHGALPHARPGERILGEGDLVVLDFGGVYDSYCVDLTRTISVGKASERSREVYAAVREAHDRAIASVAPGVSTTAVDAAARDALERRGLAETFGHGTGHGLGIEVHEAPRISRRSSSAASVALAAGMVFTIEPGVYLPGWGGVRIEDDVVVTETGVEVLTDVPTELIEV